MPVTIPGLKVLDEILSGLPTNSAQRLEINKLKDQISALQKENEEYKNKVATLTPKSDMPVETAKILKLFFDTDRAFNPAQIAAKFEMKPSVATYHIDLLLEKDLIRVRDIVIMNNAPRNYVITKEGRAYIIRHDMA